MSGEAIIIEEDIVLEAAAPPVPDQRRLGLFLFGGLLMLLINLGDPAVGMINIPVSFFLKNRLHLAAHEQALFGLVGAPCSFHLRSASCATAGPARPGPRPPDAVGTLTAAIYAVVAFMPPLTSVAGRHDPRPDVVPGCGQRRERPASRRSANKGPWRGG